MNTRFVFSDSPSTVGRHFGIPLRDNFPPRFNIAPSQPVAIIRRGGEYQSECVRTFSLVRWGFVPGWDVKGTWFKKSIVNIRSETAPEKASFKHAWRRRHCLFPMNGFYEWLKQKDGKQPVLIARAPDMPLFALAGLWEHWLGEDGSEMETAAFLTRPASGSLTQIHTRVPVYVPPERYDDWLHTDETDDRLAQEIVNLPPPEYVWWKVDRAVNSWKTHGPQLIVPIPEPPRQKDLF